MSGSTIWPLEFDDTPDTAGLRARRTALDQSAACRWPFHPDMVAHRRVPCGPRPPVHTDDHLHLISGPLGSLDALHDPVLEDLRGRDGGVFICLPGIRPVR